MGRRRWKQYQDTLYSGTRSSESTTAQPHHRLYPALSSSCNQIPGSLDQIGPQLHHPAPSSLPPAVAPTALTTATPTTTTTTTTTTALATGVVKQESLLQRHHLQNHHHHLQTPAQDHLQEDSRRLRPAEIKVEAGDEGAADGVAREDAATRTTTDTATSTTTTTTVGAATTTTTTATSTTTTATGTTTIATRRRRGRRQNDGESVADGEEDGDENDDEAERGQNEAEKRLKLDEDADNRSAISPLRTENDRATRDHPTANATDTEGTKVGRKFVVSCWLLIISQTQFFSRYYLGLCL